MGYQVTVGHREVNTMPKAKGASSTAKKTKLRKKKRQYTAPALEKGLQILELLSSEESGLTQTAIAARLGRTLGEIFRMMIVLEEMGYVKLSKVTDNYSITLRMFELSHRFPPVNRLISASLPVLKRLAAAVGQSCHIVVYSDGKGLVVAQRDNPGARTFSVRLGTTVNLTSTCSGHLILAYSSAAKRKEMLSLQSPKVKQSFVKTELPRVIERILKQGYESHKSESYEGVHDFGFPIFDSTGAMIASIVVPYLARIDGSEKADFKTTIHRLRESAATISELLGYKPR